MQFSFIVLDSRSMKLVSHTMKFTVQSGARKRQSRNWFHINKPIKRYFRNQEYN